MAERTGLLQSPRAGERPPVSQETLEALTNDAVVIRLHYTINHLSRWLTPIHDATKLVRSVRRGEPAVKDLLVQMRNQELIVFPKIYLISVKSAPDLDQLPLFTRTSGEIESDRSHSPFVVMAEFRRLRQSTLSLLRNLPNDAWSRSGSSRREHPWTIRQLAEVLLAHDYAVLAELDDALERTGARDGLAAAQRARLPELLGLNPAETRR